VRYLADVHISPLSVRALRAKGHEISRITEFLLPTATDLEILDIARREGAVLITADLDFVADSHPWGRKDFTARICHAKPAPPWGWAGHPYWRTWLLQPHSQ